MQESVLNGCLYKSNSVPSQRSDEFDERHRTRLVKAMHRMLDANERAGATHTGRAVHEDGRLGVGGVRRYGRPHLVKHADDVSCVGVSVARDGDAVVRPRVEPGGGSSSQ